MAFGGLMGLSGLPVVVRNTFLHIGSNETDQSFSQQLTSLRKAKSDSMYVRDTSAQDYKTDDLSLLTTVKEEKTLPLTPRAFMGSKSTTCDDLSSDSECGGPPADVEVGEANPEKLIHSTGHDVGKTCTDTAMATHDSSYFGNLLVWGGPPVVVRNTFLHIGSNETDQSFSQQFTSLRKAKSDSMYVRDASAQDYKTDNLSLLTTVKEEKTLPLTPRALMGSKSTTCDDLSSDSECGGPPADVEVVEANPEKLIGSSGHDVGACKPCIWYWKREGCRRGDDCEHCHLCDAKAIRRRKKALKRIPPSKPVQDEFVDTCNRCVTTTGSN